MTTYLTHMFYYEHVNGQFTLFPLIADSIDEKGQPVPDRSVSVSHPYTGVIISKPENPVHSDDGTTYSAYGSFTHFLAVMVPFDMDLKAMDVVSELLPHLIDKVPDILPVQPGRGHSTHCCEIHGCKYGSNYVCPVYRRQEEQEVICEQCFDARDIPAQILELQEEYDRVQEIKVRIAKRN